MSFFTWLLDAAGGYARGRQQRFENQQQQQQLDQNKAYREQEMRLQQESAARQKVADTAALRGQNLDPSGKPLNLPLPLPLTQVRPNNQGRGGQSSLQELYNHENQLAQFYASQGVTGLANLHAGNATEYERQLQAQTTQQQQWARDVYNQMQQTGRADITDRRQRDLLEQRENFDSWLRGQPTYRDLHPQPGKNTSPEALATATAKWYEEWNKLTKGKLKDPKAPPSSLNPIVYPIPRDLIPAAGRAFSTIDASPDPIGTAQRFAAATPIAELKSMFLKRAAIAAQKRNAWTVAPGGSNDGGDPQYPGP